MNELDLFAAAIAMLDRSGRDAYLDRECSGRSGLRERLDLLLAQHDRSQPLLDRPIGADRDDPTADHRASSLVGTVIAGRHKLLEQVGEGGMGTVWIAEQTEPVRRKVPPKLIETGMDSRAVLARFEAEAAQARVQPPRSRAGGEGPGGVGRSAGPVPRRGYPGLSLLVDSVRPKETLYPLPAPPRLGTVRAQGAQAAGQGKMESPPDVQWVGRCGDHGSRAALVGPVESSSTAGTWRP
jgi:hypothetical protein